VRAYCFQCSLTLTGYSSSLPERDDGKRFVVRADEKLTAFVELERANRESLRKVYDAGDFADELEGVKK
jgi:hypothetical protein